MHETGAMVQWSGGGTAGGDELVKGNARVARARSCGIADRPNDRVSAVTRSAPHVTRDDRVTVTVERRDDRADMGTAEVDAEEVVVAQTLGSLPASSGDDRTLASPSMTLFCAAL